VSRGGGDVDGGQNVYHFDGQELYQTTLPGEAELQLGLVEGGDLFASAFRLDLE
jgi:hypothetical protein